MDCSKLQQLLGYSRSSTVGCKQLKIGDYSVVFNMKHSTIIQFYCDFCCSLENQAVLEFCASVRLWQKGRGARKGNLL